MPEDNKKSRWTGLIIWYRKDLWPVLNESKYPLLFMFWVAVVITGYLGFSDLNPSESVTSNLYLTMQIFVMPAGNFQGSPSLLVNIARIGATILLYISFIALAAHSFYQQLELFWLRLFTRNHIVICGLGNTGTTIIRNSLSTTAAAIVVIERDPAHKEIGWCRSNGITVVIGDATERGTLGGCNKMC
jgi:hypothetical protein